MKNVAKYVTALVLFLTIVTALFLPMTAFAAEGDEAAAAGLEVVEAGDTNYRLSTTSMKALAAAIACLITMFILVVSRRMQGEGYEGYDE